MHWLELMCSSPEQYLAIAAGSNLHILQRRQGVDNSVMAVSDSQHANGEVILSSHHCRLAYTLYVYAAACRGGGRGIPSSDLSNFSLWQRILSGSSTVKPAPLQCRSMMCWSLFQALHLQQSRIRVCCAHLARHQPAEAPAVSWWDCSASHLHAVMLELSARQIFGLHYPSHNAGMHRESILRGSDSRGAACWPCSHQLCCFTSCQSAASALDAALYLHLLYPAAPHLLQQAYLQAPARRKCCLPATRRGQTGLQMRSPCCP